MAIYLPGTRSGLPAGLQHQVSSRYRQLIGGAGRSRAGGYTIGRDRPGTKGKELQPEKQKPRIAGLWRI